MFTVAKKAECMQHTLSAPANANVNDDSLIAAVEDFLPPPSPTPMDFTDKFDWD